MDIGGTAMAGRRKLGPISEPDYADLLRALSATSKGRSFLDEYRRRALPSETKQLRASLSQIEATLGTVRDQLQPERIADELRHISMTLDIAIEGATIDPEGDDTARRFALCDRARHELAALAHSLGGEVAPGPKGPEQD
jgi:hypothetical protein